MDCGMKCLRILLFIFNFIFWVLGIGLLVLGILSRTQSGSWDNLVKDTFILNAANILIAAGVVVGLIGFLGCCGALRKNTCMLTSFAICIVLIFILELAGGIYAYTKKDDLQKDIGDGIKDAISTQYGNKTDVEFTEAIDWFQENVECCGSANPTDWIGSKWYKEQKIPKYNVPQSCCKKVKKDCNKGTVADLVKGGKIYEKGCVTLGKDFVKNQLNKVGGAAIGIGVVQLLGIIFACCLCQQIKRDS